MPELSTAPADSAVTGAEKLLTLGFENVTVQQVADANESKSTDIASAATTDIGTATTPFVHVTGSTGPITALGTVQAGTRRIVVFDSTPTLTHNATSLILPTAANITAAAGDVAVFVSEGSGNWRCVSYQRANGTALATVGGGASIGVQYDADTGSTADSDPGAGLMKWNNATQASATVLYLDDDTSDGVSLTGWWSALDAGGFCYLQHATDQDTWQIWEIGTITDATGYVKLAVTLLANGGSFADGDPMLITLEQGVVSSGSTQGKQAIYISAAGMRPSTTGGCAALAAIAGASGQPDKVTLDFDPTTQEYAQFSFVMPKKWNEGTITFVPQWSHAATTTNFGVVWDLQAVACSNDDTMAVNFGTAQLSTDTGGTTDDIYMGPESSAITVGGTPAAEDMVFFRLSRVTGNGSDTMEIDARLHGITVYVTTDADTDA